MALELFIARGFDATSMDDVAAAAGVSRRTLFRYFPSKAALPWGDFGGMLEVMRASFAAVPADIGTHTALADALVGFNSFPDAETERHRARMRLLLQVDTLTAHSALMYADWRLAVAEFVARRRGERPAALIPAAVAHAMLGVALAAYEVWSREPGTPQSRLHELLRDGVAIIDPEIH